MAFILALLITYITYGFFKKKYENTLLCLALGYLSSVAIVSFLTVSVCTDGWGSMSIGLQGACSHHGGVTTKLNGLGILIFLVCIVYIYAKHRPFKRDIEGQCDKPFISEIIKNKNDGSFGYRTGSREEENEIKERCRSHNITYKFKHEINKHNVIAHFEFNSENDLNTAIKTDNFSTAG